MLFAPDNIPLQPIHNLVPTLQFIHKTVPHTPTTETSQFIHKTPHAAVCSQIVPHTAICHQGVLGKLDCHFPCLWPGTRAELRGPADGPELLI